MENLTKQLIRFVEIIQNLEFTILENHGLKGKSFFQNTGKVPKEGLIECNNQKVTYRMHGAGCTFKYENGIVLDYDFTSEMNTPINFSPWKFSRFLNTVQTEKEYTQEELLPYLEEMVIEGVLVKHPRGFYQYGITDDILKQ